MMKKISQSIILIVSILSASPGTANSDWTLELLMQSLSEINSFKAEFEEVKDFSIFSDAIVVKGLLNYVKPNYLERRIETPHQELTIIEDDVIRIERNTGGDSEQTQEQQLSLDIHPAVRTLIESIRATFAGDMAVLKKYYQLAFVGTREDWKLTLEPLQDNVKEFVNSVVISGSDKLVKRIKTIEADESESEITIIKSTLE